MTKNVVSVKPNTLLVEAADIMSKNNFSGVPVTTMDGKLVGILTEYDLVTKGAKLHLPTFIKLLKDFEIHKKDKSLIRHDVENILTITVKDVMNDEPFVLEEHATLEEAVLAFAEHHRVNPIPIVDTNNRLRGIISRFDVIKFYSPFPSKKASFLHHENDIDKKTNTFLNAFGNKFIFVSKFRTNYWLLWSLLYTIVGFFIALFFLGKVTINY